MPEAPRDAVWKERCPLQLGLLGTPDAGGNRVWCANFSEERLGILLEFGLTVIATEAHPLSVISKASGWIRRFARDRAQEVGMLCFGRLDPHPVVERSAARGVCVRIDELAQQPHQVGRDELERRGRVGAALQEILHTGGTR